MWVIAVTTTITRPSRDTTVAFVESHAARASSATGIRLERRSSATSRGTATAIARAVSTTTPTNGTTGSQMCAVAIV